MVVSIVVIFCAVGVFYKYLTHILNCRKMLQRYIDEENYMLG